MAGGQTIALPGVRSSGQAGPPGCWPSSRARPRPWAPSSAGSAATAAAHGSRGSGCRRRRGLRLTRDRRLRRAVQVRATLIGGSVAEGAVAKNSLEECKDQLLRLARSQVPTSKLAARAGLIALGFWAELRGRKRSELRHWLDVQHADAQQLIATSRLNAGVRKAEVMMGAMDAIKKIAPPEQG